MPEEPASAASRSAVDAWAEIAEEVPDGLALVDERGLFVRLNAQGAALCRAPQEDLLAAQTPFDLSGAPSSGGAGLFEDGGAEQVCSWASPGGPPREFAYRSCPWRRDASWSVVAFRDVTAERHRRRRIAAIARSAANLASAGSVGATLDALAQEVLHAGALAGVQIMISDEPGERLEIIGSAGFRYLPDFFERMMRCRERGADLRMLEVLESGRPVVVPDRWRATKDDPAWSPMHDYLLELDWDCFASVPLLVRGQVRGVLNAFCAPDQVVGGEMVEFLLAMAEQAAIAVDHAALLHAERELARREERQRLARDLHDSVVQRVFSVGMQARSLRVLGERADTVPSSGVRRIAEEIGTLSKTALTDLRALVHELDPDSATRLGLEHAVRTLADSTAHRTGLHFDLDMGDRLDDVVPPDLAEDAYRIVAEGIHNASKHAHAGQVRIRMGTAERTLRMTITDDGRGLELPESANGGYGLRSMRERAQKWSGAVGLRPGRHSGAVLWANIPLPPDPEAARAHRADPRERDAR